MVEEVHKIMVFIKALHPTRLISSTRPLQRELLWYDGLKKKMRRFSGGKIGFEYKFDPTIYPPGYRLLPKAEEVLEKYYHRDTNKKFLPAWFNNNIDNDQVDTISSHADGVVYSVPESDIDTFINELDDSDIEYEIIGNA